MNNASDDTSTNNMPELSPFQNQKVHAYIEQLNNPDYSKLWESCLGKVAVGASKISYYHLFKVDVME